MRAAVAPAAGLIVLEPVRGGSATRLIMRARVRYAPVWPGWLVRAIIAVGFGIGDFVQAGAMLLGIRSRVENRFAAP